jgi:hypothetical protein
MTIDELVDAKLAEGRVWLDNAIADDMREVIAACRGLEHIPGIIQYIRRRRERLAAWRSVKLFELHAALLAEIRRIGEYEMDDIRAGSIVAISHDSDGNPIMIDDRGQRFTTDRGKFEWRPLPSPVDPVKPPPSRWRRAA